MKRKIDQELTRERIVYLRRKNGYEQEDVAQLLEGSRPYYNSIEKGRVIINEKIIRRLAKFYNIDYDEICIYEESEYDKLENTMNILDSYRPTNYYMVRHGNLEEDIADLIKYFEKSNITEYNLLDPMLNNIGYDVKLINIKKYIENWKHEVNNSISIVDIIKSKKFLSYLGNDCHDACILLAYRGNQYSRYLISIDRYLELENKLHGFLIFNLEDILDEYIQFKKSIPKPPNTTDEIDNIIAENTKKEDHDNEIDSLIGYSQAKLHLLKINEYIGKFLDMEDELKRNTKEKN